MKAHAIVIFVFVLLASELSYGVETWEYNEIFPPGTWSTYLVDEYWYPGDARFPKLRAEDQHYVLSGFRHSVNILSAWGGLLGETVNTSYSFPTRTWTATWEWDMAYEEPLLSTISQHIGGAVSAYGFAQYDFYTQSEGKAEAESKHGIGVQIIGSKRVGNDNIVGHSNTAGAIVKIETDNNAFLYTTGGAATINIAFPPSASITIPLPPISGTTSATKEFTQSNLGITETNGGYIDAYVVTWKHTGLNATVKTIGADADSFYPEISKSNCVGVSYFEIQPGP